MTTSQTWRFSCRWLLLLLLITALLPVITGCTLIPSGPANKQLKVAVFEEGVSTDSMNSCVNILLDHGIEAKRINGASIRNDGLQGYDVLVFPGGGGGDQARALGSTGCAKVEEFVKNGGGVIGICAGGYLIAKGYSTETSWLELIDVEILDVDNWARGSGNVKVKVETDHPILKGYEGTLTARYVNGPLLTEPSPLPYQILMTFAGAVNQTPAGQRMTGTPALVVAGYGKGRCVWISFHPELTDGLEDLYIQAVLWAAN